MIEKSRFRSAMSRLGAAVNIITTNGAAGRHGMTASAVCSVSDEPASLLVCINRTSRMNAVLARNGVLCINVLSGEHEALSGIFATGDIAMEERFARAEWIETSLGVPALRGALTTFCCRVESISEVGTHGVFFCYVEDLISRADGEGLIYFGRGYHRLPLSEAA